MVKGYLFDYGGTLDTGGNHWGKVIWHAYRHLGVPVSEVQYREAYVHGERTLARQPIIRPDFTFRQTLEAKVSLQLQYLGMADTALPAAHGETALGDTVLATALVDILYAQTKRHTAHSREVLVRLAAESPLVLVSNFYGNIHTVLREFGLDGLFQSVIESAVVGFRKPDPRIFALGVETLGLKAAEVVVVGDSMDKDILPARKAGCRTVWIEGEPWTDTPVDRTVPDRIITDLTELI